MAGAPRAARGPGPRLRRPRLHWRACAADYMGVKAVARKPRVVTLLRLLPLVPLVLIAVLTPAPREPAVRATAATGNVKLANSRSGGAIVSAAGMNPGDSVTGSVTI